MRSRWRRWGGTPSLWLSRCCCGGTGTGMVCDIMPHRCPAFKSWYPFFLRMGKKEMLVRKSVIAALAVATFGVASAADLMVTDPWCAARCRHRKQPVPSCPCRASRACGSLPSSPAAGATEIHSMVMEDGVMKMRPLSFLEVPAGVKVDLKPGATTSCLCSSRHLLWRATWYPLR